jgi:glycosyltransferase involved in cell wall biosynthesis
MEALALFTRDPRPKNVMIHQDMEVIRNKESDIGWRHVPWLYEFIEPRLFRTTDHIFCVRQSAVARYRKIYPALAERFSFLPTWVDTSVFYPLNSASERQNQRQRLGHRYGIADSAEILVWVGRLDRQKDPILLLNAMKIAVKSHPNAHLLMVGDGNLRQQVEAHIRLLELGGHISLCGAIPPPQIAEIMQVAGLFVLSSAYEGMPIVVLEALATGVPVVTTEVGEVRLVVHDGTDGFIVADRSPDALGRGIGDALSLGDSMRGPPCEQAISAYTPDQVLRHIYDNHRAQAATSRR